MVRLVEQVLILPTQPSSLPKPDYPEVDIGPRQGLWQFVKEYGEACSHPLKWLRDMRGGAREVDIGIDSKLVVDERAGGVKRVAISIWSG